MAGQERGGGAPDRLWWGVLCGAAGSLLTTLAFVVFLALGGVLQVEMPKVSLFDAGAKRAKAPLVVSGAPLFTLAGSNTIGSDLAPRLVVAFLKTKGYRDLVIGRRDGAAKATDIVVRGVDASGAVRFVELLADGSKTAPPALAAGRADIAMMSSPMDDEQARLLASRFDGDPRREGTEHIIALDGVSLLVNHASPVTALSRDLIARIFAGEVQDWREAGRDRPGPIAVMRRDNDSGTFETFTNLVMKPAGKTVASTAAPYSDSDELVRAAGANAEAIGFAGMGFASRGVKAVAVSEQADAIALPPAPNWIKLELYPLSRRLFLYAPAGAGALPGEFIAFALSPAAGAEVRAAGFVDLDVARVPGEDARPIARRLTAATPGAADYLKRVETADRLSADLHFEDQALDRRGARDIGRLAAFLAAKHIEGGRVILAGFGDSAAGDAAGQAAGDVDRVRAALAAVGLTIAPAQTIALGAAPVAIADSPQARHRNRRVEVWVSR